MGKRSRAIAALAIIRVAFVSYGYGGENLPAGGSTAMAPVMAFRASNFAYHGYRFTYEGVGSGTGIARLLDNVYAIAASDEYAPAGLGLVNIPVLVQAFVFVANVPFELRLNASIIADIYLGKVAYRDDPAIRALNPGIDLPHEAIIAVHRKDSSGTTAVITSRLAKNSPERASEVGSGDSVNRPVDDTGRGIAAIGNSGVADAVRRTPYSIGYVGFARAASLGLRVVELPDGSGEFLKPSIEAFSEAVESFEESRGIPEDFRAYILDAPRGRPIVSFGYVVIREGLANLSGTAREAAIAFLKYIVTSGQAVLPQANFAELPPAIVSRVLEILNSLREPRMDRRDFLEEPREELRERYEVTYCKYCGRVKRGDRRGFLNPVKLIAEKYAERVARRLPPGYRVKAHKVFKTGEERDGYRLYEVVITVSGPEGRRLRRHFRLRENLGVCPRCSRKLSGYYEALVQIRGPKDKVEEAFEEIRGSVEALDSFVRFERVKEGINVYFLDHPPARRMARELVKRRGAKHVVTRSLLKIEDGKRKGIETHSVRLPEFRPRDLVRLDGRLYVFLGVRSGRYKLARLEDLKVTEHPAKKQAELVSRPSVGVVLNSDQNVAEVFVDDALVHARVFSRIPPGEEALVYRVGEEYIAVPRTKEGLKRSKP